MQTVSCAFAGSYGGRAQIGRINGFDKFITLVAADPVFGCLELGEKRMQSKGAMVGVKPRADDCAYALVQMDTLKESSDKDMVAAAVLSKRLVHHVHTDEGGKDEPGEIRCAGLLGCLALGSEVEGCQRASLELLGGTAIDFGALGRGQGVVLGANGEKLVQDVWSLDGPSDGDFKEDIHHFLFENHARLGVVEEDEVLGGEDGHWGGGKGPDGRQRRRPGVFEDIGQGGPWAFRRRRGRADGAGARAAPGRTQGGGGPDRHRRLLAQGRRCGLGRGSDRRRERACPLAHEAVVARGARLIAFDVSPLALQAALARLAMGAAQLSSSRRCARAVPLGGGLARGHLGDILALGLRLWCEGGGRSAAAISSSAAAVALVISYRQCLRNYPSSCVSVRHERHQVPGNIQAVGCLSAWCST